MLVPGDGALFAETDYGPLALRNEGPREPVHIQAEVVQPPEVNVGRDRPGLEDLEEQLCRGIDNDFGEKEGESPVLGDGPPAVLIRPMLHGRQGFHGLPPGAPVEPAVRPPRGRPWRSGD